MVSDLVRYSSFVSIFDITVDVNAYNSAQEAFRPFKLLFALQKNNDTSSLDTVAMKIAYLDMILRY